MLLVDQSVQAKGPDLVAVQRGCPATVATHSDRDVLVGAVGPGHRRRADRQSGLEVPQHIASRRIVGFKIAVDLTAEYQAARGRQCTIALVAAFALLPHDLVVSAVHRRERVANRRPERGGAAAATIALAVDIRCRPHRRGTGLLAAHDVDETGLRVIRRRAPLRSAVARRTGEGRDVPERREDAPAAHETRDWIWTLIDETVADRVRLRRGRELARFLLDWLLVDADQRLAIGAIEEVQPASLARLVQPLAHLAVVHLVEQHHRARRIEVPEVVMDFLEVPLVLPSLVVERDNRGREQVVALTDVATAIRTGIARTEIQHTQIRVDRRRLPDGGTAPLPGIRNLRIGIVRRGPTVTEWLAWSRNRVEDPDDLASLGVQRRHAAAGGLFTTRDAGEDQTIVVAVRA